MSASTLAVVNFALLFGRCWWISATILSALDTVRVAISTSVKTLSFWAHFLATTLPTPPAPMMMTLLMGAKIAQGGQDRVRTARG